MFHEVGNSKYYNYHLSVNGTPEVHKDDPKTDYLTDIIVSQSPPPLTDVIVSQSPPPFLHSVPVYLLFNLMNFIEKKIPIPGYQRNTFKIDIWIS